VTLDDDGIMNFPLAMRSQVKLHPEITFNATFGDALDGIECDEAGIKQIFEFVTNSVIPRFARFFLSSGGHSGTRPRPQATL